jgi:hypothetical protein
VLVGMFRWTESGMSKHTSPGSPCVCLRRRIPQDPPMRGPLVRVHIDSPKPVTLNRRVDEDATIVRLSGVAG